jgi:phosphohistidine phosphatase
MMKTLYLVRHAKSSWKQASLPDRERPLNKRGLRNAPEMGLRLKQKDAQVERIISSPAARAIATARLIASEINYPLEQIKQDERLYFTSFTALLELIRQLPASVSGLMLVGHNPDMTALLHLLCRSAIANDIADMPTCAIATLQFDTDWVELEVGQASLVEYDYPRKV